MSNYNLLERNLIEALWAVLETLPPVDDDTDRHAEEVYMIQDLINLYENK